MERWDSSFQLSIIIEVLVGGSVKVTSAVSVPENLFYNFLFSFIFICFFIFYIKTF